MTATSTPRLPAAVALDAWVKMHGPLGQFSVLVLALDICARVSRLTDAELSHTIGSLTMTAVTRLDRGGWSWTPTRVGRPAQAVSDTEVLERLGVILFHCLTGQALPYPFPVEPVLRAQLRSARPELPANVADLTIEAVSARDRGLTLPVFARGVRQVLGVARESAARRSRRSLSGLGAASALLAVSLGSWWALTPGAQDRIGTHGLTRRESAIIDVSAETAQSSALRDEHTAAIQQYQEIGRLWRTRVGPEDPRLAWNEVHEAWVRTLAGDRLTTEQLLDNKPSWLAGALSDRHPYTRAVRLALAATLDARGATAEAAVLRAETERAGRDLLQKAGLETVALDEAPVPPGVLAHVAPNAPELEGFRRGSDGGFLAPLTSTERWIAARDGWRLHIVATGPCRTSFVAGADSRRITVTAAREADATWRVQFEGATPPGPLRSAHSNALGVSLIARGTALEARLGQERISLAIDNTIPPPDPPYALAFGGDPQRACDVVWLEIPYPNELTFRPR